MEKSESVEKLVSKDAEGLANCEENTQLNNLHKESIQEQQRKNEESEDKKKEIDLIMDCDCTEIKSIEDEKETEDLKYVRSVNNTNPKITISEPVNSPCESDVGATAGTDQKQPPKVRCPIYYGIKSYIQDFYYPPDKEVLKNGDYIQEDDFQYLVDPGGERLRGGGRGRWWYRAGLWAGVNLMLVGVIALAVGHLTPPRPPVVDQQGDLTVLDRWAVTFNSRLLYCQMAGLAGFTIGAFMVFVLLMLSTYNVEHSSSYCVMAATVVPETFVGSPLAGPRQGWSHRIPLSGSVRGVQPTFTTARER